MAKRILITLILCLVIIFLALGCGSSGGGGSDSSTSSDESDDTIPTPSDPTYTDDGVTGGTFSSSDGNFSATAPSGSIPTGLSANPTVTDSSIDTDTLTAEGDTVVSDVYQLDLDSIDHFITTQTIEVSIAFDATDIPTAKQTSQYIFAKVYDPDTGDSLDVFGSVSGSTLTFEMKGLPKNAIYAVVYNPDIRIVYSSSVSSRSMEFFATPTSWSAPSSNWKVNYNPNHATLRSVVAGILSVPVATLSNEAIDTVVQERIADNAATAAEVYETAGFRQPNLVTAESCYQIHIRTDGKGSSYSYFLPDENASFEGFTTGRLNIAPTRMDDAKGSNLGSIIASIAHEMHHAIQHGYDTGTSTSSRPIKEGAAVPYGILIDTHESNADSAATEPTIRPSPAAPQKLSDYLLYGVATNGAKTPAYQHQDFFTWIAKKYGSNSLGGWLPTLYEQIKSDLDEYYALHNNANVYIRPSLESTRQSMSTAFYSSFSLSLADIYNNFARDRALEHTETLRTGEPAAGTLNSDLFATDAKKSVTVDDPEDVPSNPITESFTNIAPYSSRVITFTPAQEKDDVNISITVTATTNAGAAATLGTDIKATLYRAGATTGTNLTNVKNLIDYGSSTDDVLIVLLANVCDDALNASCRLGPPTENTIEATVVISETNYAFDPIFVAGDFASVTGSINRSDLPTVVGYERTGAQVLNGDIISIFTDPITVSTLGGTYDFNEEDEVFGDYNGGASLTYTTPSITHADDGTVVVFESIDGKITFESYGPSNGDYLEGNFYATVTGSREVESDPGDEDTREGITGTVFGSFGVTLGTSTEYRALWDLTD